MVTEHPWLCWSLSTDLEDHEYVFKQRGKARQDGVSVYTGGPLFSSRFHKGGQDEKGEDNEPDLK
ncbi:hypothetical protein NKDENANG_01074 [Candidatus Entotheonellaceae bacterium PAL068K]